MSENTNSIAPACSNFVDKVEFMFEADNIFRDLCQDYILCCCTLVKMKTESNTCNVHIEEYEHLQHKLQQDMLQMITEKE